MKPKSTVGLNVFTVGLFYVSCTLSLFLSLSVDVCMFVYGFLLQEHNLIHTNTLILIFL